MKLSNGIKYFLKIQTHVEDALLAQKNLSAWGSWGERLPI